MQGMRLEASGAAVYAHLLQELLAGWYAAGNPIPVQDERVCSEAIQCASWCPPAVSTCVQSVLLRQQSEYRTMLCAAGGLCNCWSGCSNPLVPLSYVSRVEEQPLRALLLLAPSSGSSNASPAVWLCLARTKGGA
jgi:hypothetical protein